MKTAIETSKPQITSAILWEARWIAVEASVVGTALFFMLKGSDPAGWLLFSFLPVSFAVRWMHYARRPAKA